MHEEMSTPAKFLQNLCLSVLVLFCAVFEGAKCAAAFIREEMPEIWRER